MPAEVQPDLFPNKEDERKGEHDPSGTGHLRLGFQEAGVGFESQGGGGPEAYRRGNRDRAGKEGNFRVIEGDKRGIGVGKDQHYEM